MKHIRKALSWATSPKGSAVIHRTITALLALYVGLHRAGAL